MAKAKMGLFSKRDFASVSTTNPNSWSVESGINDTIRHLH